MNQSTKRLLSVITVIAILTLLFCAYYIIKGKATPLSEEPPFASTDESTPAVTPRPPVDNSPWKE